MRGGRGLLLGMGVKKKNFSFRGMKRNFFFGYLTPAKDGGGGCYMGYWYYDICGLFFLAMFDFSISRIV